MKSRVKRFAIIGLSSILLIAIGLGIYTWLHWSPAGSVYIASGVAHIELPHRLRNGAEHDAARSRNGGNPYILRIDTEYAGSLLYYGASHTRNPGHPQISDITSRWNVFKPTVALYEGRSRGYFYGALIEPFAGLPEPALVHKLARHDDIPLYSLEPAYADEVAELLQLFSAEQIALYFFLRVYSSEAGGVSDEALALDLLSKRTDVDGLRRSLSTLADVDRLWQRDFPDQDDWRIYQGEPSYLDEISDSSRRIRGEHMARILIDLVERGERVFAVVGSGHVIRQEWNLCAAFDQEPAWDQPAGTTSQQGERTHLDDASTVTPGQNKL
ncbi:MAG: TraB/GumN family protein [Planctomycetes bacterium]|nr:TraB/GumN family protein [Planctomycetota bacterium]